MWNLSQTHKLKHHRGAGPAQQSDWWIHHIENKTVPFFITGLGVDIDYVKVMFQGYATPYGDYVVTISVGGYFGRKKKQ